ncbi:MAG: Holliday junction resolvase RuvX [Dehalococcoidia bacterium]|nr:Holliday junction resolvase RuvX [Dehalococcoidia bacterium]
MRILALDVGDRYIGVALSDPTGLIASPLPVLERTGGKRDYERVLAVVKAQEAARIIIGMPITMSGEEGEQAQATNAFVAALKERTALPVETLDERLTTVEAERRMREAGASSRRMRQRTDSQAAAVLLQGYLDAQRLRRAREDAGDPS